MQWTDNMPIAKNIFILLTALHVTQLPGLTCSKRERVPRDALGYTYTFVPLQRQAGPNQP